LNDPWPVVEPPMGQNSGSRLRATEVAVVVVVVSRCRQTGNGRTAACCRRRSRGRRAWRRCETERETPRSQWPFPRSPPIRRNNDGYAASTTNRPRVRGFRSSAASGQLSLIGALAIAMRCHIRILPRCKPSHQMPRSRGREQTLSTHAQGLNGAELSGFFEAIPWLGCTVVKLASWERARARSQ